MLRVPKEEIVPPQKNYKKLSFDVLQQSVLQVIGQVHNFCAVPILTERSGFSVPTPTQQGASWNFVHTMT